MEARNVRVPLSVAHEMLAAIDGALEAQSDEPAAVGAFGADIVAAVMEVPGVSPSARERLEIARQPLIAWLRTKALEDLDGESVWNRVVSECHFDLVDDYRRLPESVRDEAITTLVPDVEACVAGYVSIPAFAARVVPLLQQTIAPHTPTRAVVWQELRADLEKHFDGVIHYVGRERQLAERLVAQAAERFHIQWLPPPRQPVTVAYSPTRAYAVGDILRHSSFGVGCVQSVREGKMEVAFDGNKRVLACGSESE